MRARPSHIESIPYVVVSRLWLRPTDVSLRMKKMFCSVLSFRLTESDWRISFLYIINFFRTVGAVNIMNIIIRRFHRLDLIKGLHVRPLYLTNIYWELHKFVARFYLVTTYCFVLYFHKNISLFGLSQLYDLHLLCKICR